MNAPKKTLGKIKKNPAIIAKRTPRLDVQNHKNRLQAVQQAAALQGQDDLVNNGTDALLLGIDDHVGLGRGLVGVVDTGEALDLAVAGALVDALLVRLLAVLERGGDVDQVEVAKLLDELLGALAVDLIGGDGGGDDGGAGAGQLTGDKGDAANVLAAVVAAEAELRGELRSDGLAEQEGDGAATLLVQGNLESTGNGVLAAVLVTSQEDSETLLRAGRVRLAEDLDDLGVREPLGDLTTASESGAQLGTGDVGGADVLGDSVDGSVLVAVGEVGHHLEGNDLDTELIPVLLDGVLGVVGAVEVDTLAVLAGAGVVTSDNEVGGTMVLADDGVPDGLTGTTHSHGQWQETQDGHAVGVSWQKRLVDTDSGEVVDVTRLGQTDDGVDQDIGVVRASGADSELTVGAVHGVSGLEGDNLGPAQLVEVLADLGGSVWTEITISNAFCQDSQASRGLHLRSTKS